MNVQKLNEAIEMVKRDLGASLLATDIFTKEDGTSIAGYNTQPKACALFNELTGNLQKSLNVSGFPALNDYYLLNLVEGNMVVVLNLVEFQWGFLVDSNKVKLGLLLNIVIPAAKDAFIDALES
jgi:hypothetical protein